MPLIMEANGRKSSNWDIYNRALLIEEVLVSTSYMSNRDFCACGSLWYYLKGRSWQTYAEPGTAGYIQVYFQKAGASRMSNMILRGH